MPAIDMDDLIASFASSGHISQEAMDIAALQKQLAQTLQPYNVNPYCQMGPPSQQPPLTSPTSSWMNDEIRRRNRSASRSRRFPSQERSIRADTWGGPQAYDVAEEEEQDMQMVEDQLEYGYHNRPAQPHHLLHQEPSSWYTSSSSPAASHRTVAATATSSSIYPASSNVASFDPTTPTHSSFAAYAAIDPFFAAQLQAASSVYASSPSGFATHAFAAAPN